MTTMYSWLARTAFRRRWWIVGIWLVLFALSAVGATRAEHALKVGGFSLPGTEFNTASEVLSRDLELSSDKAALVIFHSDTHLVTDRVFYESVAAALERLDQEPEVVKTESFYSTGIPDMVSDDNHTTYAWVTLEGTESHLEEVTAHLRELVRSNDIDSYLIGQAAVNYDLERASAEDLIRVERFTFPIVFVLLVLVFGSLVAAGVPLILGAMTVVASLAVLYLVAQVTDVSIFALNTASMIGLGLAVDFSLIVVSRFREELKALDVEAALERTLQTAGRSITYSGVTLMLTMSVLALFPIMIIRSIALSIVIVAAVAIVGALLLLPALLVITAGWLHRLNLRQYIPFLNRQRDGMWYRWSFRVMRRPWISLGIGLLILGLLALPVLRLERTGVTVSALPESAESRVAFELMQRQFGLGEPTPLFVVVESGTPGGVWRPEVLEGVYTLHNRLVDDPRVESVQSLVSLIPNP